MATNGGWDEAPATGVPGARRRHGHRGRGLRRDGRAAGEVCFNTAMTGYQEILTDPSYAGQIVTFTFPHIGNVGANEEDVEAVDAARASGVRGCVVRDRRHRAGQLARRPAISTPGLKARGIIGLSGVDTRALTALIREQRHAERRHRARSGRRFDLDALKREAAALPVHGGAGPRARRHGRRSASTGTRRRGGLGGGYGSRDGRTPKYHVVAVDYGMKRNILRLLAEAGCRVTVLPATATRRGHPGARNPTACSCRTAPATRRRPANTRCRRSAAWSTPACRPSASASATRCSALALGGRTVKMHQGHHGANHPVKDFTTGKVEIVSMNHGFALDRDSLPGGRGGDARLAVRRLQLPACALKDRPVFSVQYHPEASPGPQDSHYLFGRFVEMMRESKGKAPGADA